MQKSLEILQNYDIKISVVNAMSALMATTPFERLTVSEICSAAGLSRATFYRYFKDKYSVAQWHCDYISAKGSGEIGRTMSWYEGYLISEAGFAEFKDFYRKVGKTGDYNALDIYAFRQRRQTMIDTLAQYRHVDLTDELLFQVEATANCEVSMLPRWHYGEIDAPLEQLCSWMAESVPRKLFELLDTPL